MVSCSHSASNASVSLHHDTCYPHLLKISAMSSNHMPNVSLAEGVHIGMRSATSGSQTFPLTQESSIDFHLIQKLRARHRNIVLCLLLLSARCVTLHLCPEGRPVGAILTRQSVATDKVRSHLVQPFARHIQLCQHFRFDRAPFHASRPLLQNTTLGPPYTSREKLHHLLSSENVETRMPSHTEENYHPIGRVAVPLPTSKPARCLWVRLCTP